MEDKYNDGLAMQVARASAGMVFMKLLTSNILVPAPKGLILSWTSL